MLQNVRSQIVSQIAGKRGGGQKYSPWCGWLGASDICCKVTSTKWPNRLVKVPLSFNQGHPQHIGRVLTLYQFYQGMKMKVIPL